MTPTDEQKRAWRNGEHSREFVAHSLAGFVRDLLAALMESEFKREHRLWPVSYSHFQKASNLECEVTNAHPCTDPRHNYTAADWQREAAKQLREP